VVLVGTPPHMAGLEDAQHRHWEEFASDEKKALLERRLCELEELGGAEASVAANARAWAPMGWYDADFDPGPLLEGIVIDHDHTAAVVRGFSSVSLPAVLPQLSCPVLRIHGAHDCIVPPSLWDAHAALAPHVTSRIFERSAHHPAHEEPERFAKELLEWIAGVLDAR
jgi:pimeloyl-ACP methyl ester carboxylesterase